MNSALIKSLFGCFVSTCYIQDFILLTSLLTCSEPAISRILSSFFIMLIFSFLLARRFRFFSSALYAMCQSIFLPLESISIHFKGNRNSYMPYFCISLLRMLRLKKLSKMAIIFYIIYYFLLLQYCLCGVCVWLCVCVWSGQDLHFCFVFEYAQFYPSRDCNFIFTFTFVIITILLYYHQHY